MPHDKASWDWFTGTGRGRKANHKVDGLQRHTAAVTECAWPNCDKSTPDTYLRVGEQIKIGFSTDLHRRLRAYPPGSELLAIEWGDKKLERRRHAQFFDWLVAGREWFEASPELLAHTSNVNLNGEAQHYSHSFRRPARLADRKQPMKYVRSAWRVG